MKSRATSLLLAFYAALGPATDRARAQNQTDNKIRLMGEALTARDAGDFAAARSKLDALNQMVPNDPGVRRLLAELNRREEELREAALHPAAPPPPPIVLPAPDTTPNNAATVAEPRPSADTPAAAAPIAGVSPPASPPSPPSKMAAPSPSPGRTDNSVKLAGISVIDERPIMAPTPPDRFAEALAKVEKDGVTLARGGENQGEKLMTYVQAQRTLARAYAHDGNYAAATATLEEALRSLESSVDELRSERRDYIRNEVAAEEAKKGVRLKRHR